MHIQIWGKHLNQIFPKETADGLIVDTPGIDHVQYPHHQATSPIMTEADEVEERVTEVTGVKGGVDLVHDLVQDLTLENARDDTEETGTEIGTEIEVMLRREIEKT